MPLKIRIWLWISKNIPFISEGKRFVIFGKKVLPWMLKEALQELYTLKEKVK
ncbi:hypothetical protein ES702_02495 [subsurface metagenome]